jgi:hypothetical protein
MPVSIWLTCSVLGEDAAPRVPCGAVVGQACGAERRGGVPSRESPLEERRPEGVPVHVRVVEKEACVRHLQRSTQELEGCSEAEAGGHRAHASMGPARGLR